MRSTGALSERRKAGRSRPVRQLERRSAEPWRWQWKSILRLFRSFMQAQLKLKEIDKQTCFVKGTHREKGRTRQLSPENSASRNLYYGRVRIDSGDGPIEFSTADHETGFICLNGSATIATGDSSFQLNRYDALYVPRDSQVTVSAEGGCDLAEISSPVENQYPLQFVSFEENRKD